ncbi:MAG: hypothetical protein IPN01_24815 [Deltaproteobacteria bacterium]|nr:hypothetical protein [Deltaproteobacteria bacterium]
MGSPEPDPQASGDKPAIAALITAFLGLAVTAWGRGPDPVITYGDQVYAAWRFAEGDRLGEALILPDGPLATIVQGALFWAVGPSVVALGLLNHLLWALGLAACWRLTRPRMPAYAAMMVGLTLLVGFVFPHLTSLGNYSLVAPGVPEAAAGLWWLGMLLVVLDTQTEVSLARGALIGLCLGALALTRAEPFLAGLVATALALPLLGARPLTQLVIFIVGEGIVGLVALLWGGDVALAGLRAHAVDGGAVVSFGLEAPGENLGRLLIATGYGGAVALCVLIVDRWTARWPRRALWIEAAAWALMVPGLIVFVRWSQVGRPLPLVMGVALIVCLGLSWRRRGDSAARRRLVLPLAAAGAAAVMITPIALNGRIQGDGFTLGALAALWTVAWAVAGLPNLARGLWGGGEVARRLMMAAVGSGLLIHVGVSGSFYQRKTYALGGDADSLWVYPPRESPRSASLVRLQGFLDKTIKPGERVLVLPEGALLNVWTRTVSPTPYISWSERSRARFGEDVMLEALRQRPPDWVVWIYDDANSSGGRPFGVDDERGAATAKFVWDHCVEVVVYGAAPWEDGGYGAAALRCDPSALKSP